MTDGYVNEAREAAGRLLAGHQSALAATLAARLDIEAGLREVLIQARYDALAEDLERVLDVESGLRAIVPGAMPPLPAHAAHRWLAHLSLVSPPERMTLRGDPAVAGEYRVLVYALNAAAALERGRDRALALDRALSLDHGLDRPADRTYALGQDRNLARRLNDDLLADIKLLDNLVGVCSLDLGVLDADLAKARACLDAFTRELTTIADLVHRFSGALARDRIRDLALGLDRARARARTLADECRKRVQGTTGITLGEDPPLFGETAVEEFLNDFTDADLTDADLTGVDLIGVRWTEHGTRWPATVDVRALKSRSEESPSGSGVYVVLPGQPFTAPDTSPAT
ncbi:hypothetical protein G5C51_09685 [Streptomyces sp. A7024]|uniref:Uncharacterized protein n=1 Tax=Streptomyces coryli TaxID=1128680 RepID=A0A6G4TWB3_9ACTN|nr:hypothetical protein [Streptomyces coryli]NGN64174.1 hypothetical protein [Streptomyces coryli]